MSNGQGSTVAGLLQEVRARFAEADLDDPATEARILVGGLLRLSSTELVTRGADAVLPEDVEKARAAIGRRLNHEPVHRILGGVPGHLGRAGPERRIRGQAGPDLLSSPL